MSSETTKRIERIEASYAQTRQVLEANAHTCTWDEQGRCLYCPKRAQLMAQGRTGELVAL